MTANRNPYTFQILSQGTWTLTAVRHGYTYTNSYNITTGYSGDITISNLPDGNTVTPINDVRVLLDCAELFDVNYTAISELLADSDSLATVINSENAVNYLARSTSFTKSEALVPTMTSNTTPSGVVSASTIYSSSYDAYKAFDGDNSTSWSSTEAVNAILSYEFGEAHNINKVTILPNYDMGASHIKNFSLEVSTDGSSWSEVYSGTATNTNTEQTFTASSSVSAKYVRLNIADNYASGNSTNIALCTVQFYTEQGFCDNSTAMTLIGANNYVADTLLADNTWRDAIVQSSYRESILNVKAPIMTSNTTPSGVASASSVLNNYYPYLALTDTPPSEGRSQWYPNVQASSTANQWWQYKFSTDVKIYGVYIYWGTSSSATGTWDIGYGTSTQTVSQNQKYTTLNDVETTDTFKITCKTASGSGYFGLLRVQFYGREDV